MNVCHLPGTVLSTVLSTCLIPWPGMTFHSQFCLQMSWLVSQALLQAMSPQESPVFKFPTPWSMLTFSIFILCQPIIRRVESVLYLSNQNISYLPITVETDKAPRQSSLYPSQCLVPFLTKCLMASLDPRNSRNFLYLLITNNIIDRFKYFIQRSKCSSYINKLKTLPLSLFLQTSKEKKMGREPVRQR